jgi:hypothetical protein
MKHCFLAKKNTVEAIRLGLINIIWTLHQQNQLLRSGLLNLNEAKCASNACSGRPKEALSDENIKKVHKIKLSEALFLCRNKCRNETPVFTGHFCIL